MITQKFKTKKQDLSKKIPYQLDRKTTIYLTLSPGQTVQDAVKKHTERVEIQRLGNGGYLRGAAIH